MSHIIKAIGFSETMGVPGVERRGHINAVKPHLVRIDLFVPKAPLTRPGLRLELSHQQAHGLPISLVARLLIQSEKEFASVDLIKVEVLEFVRANAAVWFYKLLNIAFDILKILIVARVKPDLLSPLEYHAWLIAPAVRQDGPPFQARVCHSN
jgi:hypothetical protein